MSRARALTAVLVLSLAAGCSSGPRGTAANAPASSTLAAPATTGAVSGPSTAPSAGVSAATTAAPTRPAGCRTGDPLANVYHPYRLEVLRGCATVSGTVMSVRSEDDGDVHFDLAVDPPYSGMLTAGNAAYQHGWLVVEIVPADEPGCTPGAPPRSAEGSYDYGVCTGADETPPARGAHVTVTGPYVLDRDHHDWAEIHPAWSIAAS